MNTRAHAARLPRSVRRAVRVEGDDGGDDGDGDGGDGGGGDRVGVLGGAAVRVRE